MTKTLATTSESSTGTASLGAVRFSAMNLLARREHSAQELYQKLQKRFPRDLSLITEAIKQLQSENLQSDERFAEAFVASRVRRGQGPNRIGMELRQRGVEKSVIAMNLEAFDPSEWVALAKDVCARKYGENATQDRKQQAKQYRFLQYRGFSADHIRKALS
ncbi:regulatory protein RecX [Aurantivibrio plasticivorans]